MSGEVLRLVPDGLALVLCALAAVLDLRSRRIPNWLTVGGAGAGLLVNAAVAGAGGGGGVVGGALEDGLLPAALGAGVCLLAFGALGAVRAVGMGDVKLMAAVGACLRWPLGAWAMVYVLIAGGVLSLGYALARGRLRAVGRNLGAMARGRARSPLHRIPYGTAILAGTAFAVLARYQPALLP